MFHNALGMVSRKRQCTLSVVVGLYSLLVVVVQLIQFFAFRALGGLGTQEALDDYLWILTLLIGIGFVNFLLGYGFDLFQARYFAAFKDGYRHALTREFLYLDNGEYDKTTPSDWLQALFSDVEANAKLTKEAIGLFMMLPSGFIMVAVSLRESVVLTLSVIGIGCAQLALREWMNKRVLKMLAAQRSTQKKCLQLFLDAIKALPATKWFSAQPQARALVASFNTGLYNADIKTGDAQMLLQSIEIIAQYVGDIAFFGLSAILLSRSSVDIAGVLAIFAVKQSFSTPFAFIGPWRTAQKQAALYGAKLGEMLNRCVRHSWRRKHFTPLRSFTQADAAIELREVSFHYHESKPVFLGFNAEIRQGALIRIAGESGAGKTTLFRVIAGLCPPNSGSVIILGNDVAALSPQDIRRLITYIPQKYALFSDSIRNNITMRNDAIDVRLVEQAAKLARIDDFIMSLPDGYETQIVEDGKNISAGQRQRIALARSFLRDTPIYLVDEISSAVDNVTKMELQESVVRVLRDKTALIISHDAFATCFDRVLTLGTKL